ncbi:hypothetical protein, partial [Streptosporangium sp. NPDC049644]|uniref:hypothetical protein n=1 Tax=Streptosporangium sp. NPDC049644 TaxID=3155507 RepID=UPI00344A4300
MSLIPELAAFTEQDIEGSHLGNRDRHHSAYIPRTPAESRSRWPTEEESWRLCRIGDHESGLGDEPVQQVGPVLQ